LYHTDLLYKVNTNLVNFESDEEYNYFVFRKEKKMDSMFVGVYSIDRQKTLKAVSCIGNSSLFSNFFLPLHIHGDNHLWMDGSFMSKLPKFTTTCVFTRHSETGYETNENAYNWNKLINICKTKKVLLTNDDFNIEGFAFEKKYTKGYIYISNIKKARKIKKALMKGNKWQEIVCSKDFQKWTQLIRHIENILTILISLLQFQNY
jgi:hypothetical protein